VGEVAVRALVTGAAGFIGSHLAEALLEAGNDVVGLDCFTDYYDVALKEENAARLDVLRLDLAGDELDLGGYDCVFHLAGQPGTRSFGDVFETYVRRNVLATQRLFEAAAAAGVRVVLASSSSVYGDAERYPTPEDTELRPLSPYGITKLACERLAYAYEREKGLDVVSLRYFTVYGPRQRPDMFLARVVRALAGGGTVELYGSGEQSRSFTYVGDAVEATIAAGERAPSGALYNVGGGDEASMLDVIASLERVSGERLDVRRRDAVAGDVQRTRADVTRIRDELGWAPTTPLEQGLEAHWNWASGRVGAR
jgi:nucleoside-diphosphate-sugar epimerase